MATINIHRALASTHPLDILRLRSVAGRVCGGPLSDTDVERLWTKFSEDRCAGDGWLPVIDESLTDFSDWLKV